jgi:hypothetical protein
MIVEALISMAPTAMEKSIPPRQEQTGRDRDGHASVRVTSIRVWADVLDAAGLAPPALESPGLAPLAPQAATRRAMARPTADGGRRQGRCGS